jgi:hypothetical protein
LKTGEREVSARDELIIPRRNLGLAYFLLVLLGWLGAHRFYVKRPYSGTLYALTFGFLLVGVALDLLLLPRYVREVNETLVREAARDPEAFRARERIAPWAHAHTEKWSAQLLIVAGFWLFGTPIFTFFAIVAGFSSGPLYLAAMLILLALFGSPRRLLARYPKIEKTPILEHVLQRLVELEDFYFEHKPRLLIYYLAYPITMPIAAIFSRPARAEARMFVHGFGLLAGLLAINLASTYSFIFTDASLSLMDSVLMLLIVFVFAFTGLVIYLVPTTATAFALNLSGRRSQTLVFAAIGGALAVPSGLLASSVMTHSVSLPHELILSSRLSAPAFQCEFEALGRMFLRHEARGASVEGESRALVGELQVVHDQTRTERFRHVLHGFTTEDETRAFTVAKIWWSEGPTMFALVRDEGDPTRDRATLGDASESACAAQPLVIAGREQAFLTAASLEAAFPGASEALGPRFHQGGELLLFDDWLARCTLSGEAPTRDCEQLAEASAD